MLKGLRKKETYDEIINELGDEPVTKFPDRRASQLENSNYLSQLASGFQEVIQQNRVIEERTKELLLQEASGTSESSHMEARSMSFKSAGAAPARFNIHTPRDLAPQRDLQEFQDEMETQLQIEEDHNRKKQNERRTEIVAQSQQHQGVLTRVASLMESVFDAAHAIRPYVTNEPSAHESHERHMMETEPSSSSQTPVREMVTDYEKKVKKKRKNAKSSKSSDDGSVVMQGADLNKSTNIDYWKDQSANEIRNQLQLRNIPRDPRWFEKTELIKLVQELIRKKKW